LRGDSQKISPKYPRALLNVVRPSAGIKEKIKKRHNCRKSKNNKSKLQQQKIK
jgi:hypothetical protein